MIRIHAYKELVGALLTAIALLLLLNTFVGQKQSDSPELIVPPSNQDVYVLGNSMFGVGFDLNLARSLLKGKKVDFAYYNGHYSSMWHLAVSVGIKPENAPKTLVWGFRPTYAVYPSFRQNRLTEEQDFRSSMNTAHRRILANAGDPAYQGRENVSFQNSEDFGNTLSNEPFERMGMVIAQNFFGYFKVASKDSGFLSNVTDYFAKLLVSVTALFGTPEKLLDSNGALKQLKDLLIAHTSGGRIKVADALVVDNGDRFIKGHAVRFAESFVPEIIEEIRKVGSKQLIVIFRPVTTYEQPLDIAEQQYYEEALEYFNSNDLAVLDLMAIDGLEREMYADGDHLNERGRKFVTELIVEKLGRMNNESVYR